jgi:UDP-GlcNAc3NAcA epimerase
MIVTIIGARPQFVKAAVLSKAMKDHGIDEKIIHTGQHYDPKMSDIFFEELGIPGVDKNLHIGSGQHGSQTGKMMIAIEDYILSQSVTIDGLLVYGDTNSTLAGALVASKLNIPVLHIEAGLRSFNRTMPEEVNRVLTDHVSQLLFCSSEEGVLQLAKEGITTNVFNVGDIMYDGVTIFLPFAKKPNVKDFDFDEIYNLITIHRPSNTDDKNSLKGIIEALSIIPNQCIWPVHPRIKSTISNLSLPSNVFLTEPFSYFEMLYVLGNSHKVITDSGGLQKEAYWLKKPCITIRPETEWIETLHNNWNQLCKSNKSDILPMYKNNPETKTWRNLYGDGNASKRIAEIIKNNL